MRLLPLLAMICTSATAWAGDLEWSGSYRVEGLKVDDLDMGGSTRNKQYMLQHLVLTPKINAYDGVTIHTRFDIMNSDEYPNSQLGQFFGNGVGDGSTPGNSNNSNVLSEREKADFIAINQLYVNYAHEFGLLTVGRAPVHFGLGMSYNSGMGVWDHWFDNRDMVAYKVMTGNLSIMPAVAKVAENNRSADDDINDYMIQFEYDNPETDLKIGALFRRRIATRYGNDAPGNPVFGDPSSVPAIGVAPFKGDYWNFFLSRYLSDSFKFGLEVGLQKGKTGVAIPGDSVQMNGLGIALELDYIPKGEKFHAFLRAGMATGDDPNTLNTYEGYIFDRNYDVSFLMFNHPMGRYDIFRTGVNRDVSKQPSTLVDEEAISNVLYFAPSFKYRWTETFEGQFGLTYAQLNSDPLGNGVDKAVGYEIDAALTYKPYNGIQWVNRMGVFVPGDAYKGGPANNYETSTVIGFETKAAITF